MEARMLKIGDVAKDRVTGFEGVIVGRTEWLSGCITFGVQGKEMKDGRPTDAVWFDEARLTETPIATKGGPCPTPQSTMSVPR
jgi:hypothetical protein